MNGRMSNQPLLMFDSAPGQPASGSVLVYKLKPDLIGSLSRYTKANCLLQSILRVTVVETEAPIDDNLPGILGRYQVLEDGIRFTLHFHLNRDFHIEQASTLDRSVDPISRTY